MAPKAQVVNGRPVDEDGVTGPHEACVTGPHEACVTGPYTAGQPAQQASHWGTYAVAPTLDGRDIAAVTPWAADRDPSPLLGNLPGSVTHHSRVAAPAVRRGWLEQGPGPSRHRGTGRPVGPDGHPGTGPGDYVRVGWDEVLDRLAGELRRVVDRHGNQAIFGGSYGWGSAGRFHHAQSQVHRFLNGLGGYTASVNTYSTGALEVFLPRVACEEVTASQRSTPWSEIVEHTQVWLALGGVPAKNTGTNHGGTGDHPTRPALAAYLARGGRLVGVTPLRDDLPNDGEVAGAARVEWLPTRPGSDTALVLALCHTLIARNLVAQDFVATHTVGYADLAAYLLGEHDGQPKDAAWAANLCKLPADQIMALAEDLATHRSLVTATWSLQRQQYGEMALWAVVALGALLGQIGEPGGGFGFGYGSMNSPGLPAVPVRLPTLAQGSNPVAPRIPVAAIADLLLRPGDTIPYDGGRVTFPDIRLVYWAGGNPFHHHQDLNKLRRAVGRPDTIVVHDPYWTPMARHADIVIPSTTAAERDDLTGSRNGAVLVAMHAAVEPYADSRDDYDTFAALADRLGFGAAFTAGRTSAQWVRHLYDEWRADLSSGRIVPTWARPVLADWLAALPTYDEFRARGVLELPTTAPRSLLDAWRADPATHRLPTPSGRIELASPTVAALDLPDCPGVPTWFAPQEWAAGDRYPMHLIANQPRTRLHSQLDHGPTSQASKVAGREPVRLHPADAAARGIRPGDIVRVFNDRGHVLAGAVLDEGIREGVAQLATGAWYDPADPTEVPLAGATGETNRPTDPGGAADPGSPADPLSPAALDVHGNPNVLTSDRRTSAMAQATTGQLAMVQVERYDETRYGPARPVRAFQPPC